MFLSLLVRLNQNLLFILFFFSFYSAMDFISAIAADLCDNESYGLSEYDKPQWFAFETPLHV